MKNKLQSLFHQPLFYFYVILSCLYLMTSDGRCGSDGHSMYEVTRSLFAQGGFDFLPDAQRIAAVMGRGDKFYSVYGIGCSVAALPLYAVGKMIAFLTGCDSAVICEAVTSLLNSLVTPAIAVLVVLLLLRFKVAWRTAVGVGLLYAFASPAWFNAKQFMSEPLYTLCLVGAFYAAYAVGQSARPLRCALLCGLLLGFAAAVRINGVIYVPLYALFLWSKLSGRFEREATPGRPSPKTLVAAFGLMLSMVLGVIAWVNWVRFGSPLRTGYQHVYPNTAALFATPLWYGVSGLLFSPGRGLLLFWPAAIASLMVWPQFHREQREESWFILGMTVVTLLFFGKFADWQGGTFRGPRFLLPLLPFLCLVLYPAFTQKARRSRFARYALTIFVPLILLTQILQIALAPIQVIVDWREKHLANRTVQTATADTEDVWSLETLPLVGEINSFRHCLSEPTVLSRPEHLLRYPHKFDLWFLTAERQGISTKIILSIAVLDVLCLLFAVRKFLYYRPSASYAEAVVLRRSRLIQEVKL